jgi:hypothetical protein
MVCTKTGEHAEREDREQERSARPARTRESGDRPVEGPVEGSAEGDEKHDEDRGGEEARVPGAARANAEEREGKGDNADIGGELGIVVPADITAGAGMAKGMGQQELDKLHGRESVLEIDLVALGAGREGAMGDAKEAESREELDSGQAGSDKSSEGTCEGETREAGMETHTEVPGESATDTVGKSKQDDELEYLWVAGERRETQGNTGGGGGARATGGESAFRQQQHERKPGGRAEHGWKVYPSDEEAVALPDDSAGERAPSGAPDSSKEPVGEPSS